VTGYKHGIHLLDFFYHDGRNGRHLCLAFDFLGPNASFVAERGPDYRLDGSLAQAISAQVLLAVNHLHSSGIVHGGEAILTFKKEICIS
jgi:serine/threonine-protein kinase SRPK3